MDKSDYFIPKIDVNVDIMVEHLRHQGVEEYVLYLNEFSRYRKEKETLQEFLNDNKSFIPLKHGNSGEFILLNLSDVVYIKQKEKVDIQAAQNLVLFLGDNLQLEVGHLSNLPESKSRVLDYLNQENRFLLFYYGGQEIYVNKDKIVKVKEL